MYGCDQRRLAISGQSLGKRDRRVDIGADVEAAMFLLQLGLVEDRARFGQRTGEDHLPPGPDLAFGTTTRAFGHPGAGGSFAFADPDTRLGYAYVMNKMDFYLFDDPREKPLRDAIHRAIERLSS
jgi:CubicO group peptidase (beta-lactamase class C family)